MRTIELLLPPALTAALVLAGAGLAQAPGQTQGPRLLPQNVAPISVDDVVERIMAFDKNKDGKVTRDELPERMHHLIALGDTNKDGALDRDEVRKLATTRPTALGRPGPRVQTRVGFGPGPGPGPGDVEGVVEDLKLPGKKKDLAMAAVKAHQDNVRKLMEQARAQLLQKMKEILSEEELKDFEAALDRPRGETVFVGPPDGPRPGDVERRIERLQKELDDLRRELRR
jgi:hypothetical protein